MTNKSKFLLCLLIGIWHGCYANIRIGLCLDLSGPQKNYNAEFGRGLSSYFKYINSMLANSANKLELVVIDSEYNTTKYINGLKALADSQVELIITEPITILDANDKLLQIAKTQQLPMLGANLDQKLNGFYFSYKAGYKAQMQHLINTLLSQNISPYEIMLVYEDSAFGREVNNYARDFLQKLGVDFSKIVNIKFVAGENSYEAIVEKMQANPLPPKAILAWASPAELVDLIKKMRTTFETTSIATLSNVANKQFVRMLGNDIKNVMVAQTMPHFEAKLPLVNQYRLLYKQDYPHQDYPHQDYSHASLEGFFVGKIIADTIVGAGAEINSTTLISSLENTNFDTGLNIQLRFSANNHVGSERVWISHIAMGKFNINYQ